MEFLDVIEPLTAAGFDLVIPSIPGFGFSGPTREAGLQSQQPQTLTHAIEDSPAGLAGWNGQLMDEMLDIEFVVANLAVYWFTRTAGSSMRLYYENSQGGEPGVPTTVPLGLAGSEGDFHGVRRFADRDHGNIVSWNVHDVDTHYLAHSAPDLFADDVAKFYAGLR